LIALNIDIITSVVQFFVNSFIFHPKF